MASSPTASIGGLASGLDTASIVSQLVSIESIPLTQIAKARQRVVDQQAAWTRIATTYSGVADAARELSIAGRLMTPTLKSSSDTVTVTGSMPAGTALSLSVRQLATSAQRAVTGYSSASEVVGTGRVTTLARAAAIGLAKATAGAGATAGAHAVKVTQASAAATITGTVQNGPLTIGPGNDSLTVTGTDGAARTVTVASGTYSTADDLATAVNTALAGTGTSAKTVGGALTLSSGDEGSTSTLNVSGTFATTVGATGSAAGKDAVVDVDGTSATLTHLKAGDVVTVGSMTLTLAGAHLSAGTASAKVIDTTAATTVSDLASLISNGDTGLSAAVVSLTPGAGGTEILLTSKGSGTAGDVAVDLSGFSKGSVSTVRAAQDAQVMLGSQMVTRSSNTITDLVPGASLTLVKATPAGESVDITSQANPDDLMAKVKKLATAYNIAYDSVMTASKSDPSGTKIGPLNGSSQLSSVLNQLRSAVTSYSGTGEFTALAHIGVRLGRDGHLSVDEPAFKAALAKDDKAVTSLLARTGTGGDSRVSFLSATETAKTGPQAVVVTRAAERGNATGASFTSLAADETLTITYGTSKLTFAAAAGASSESIAASLDSALRTAGIGITASSVAGALSLTTTSYGATAAFSVTSTGAGTGLDGVTAAGVDAEGTINGAAATGSGQRLTSTGTAGGVSVRVAATADEIAAAGGALDLGTLTYSKGIAGSVADLVSNFKNKGGVFATAADTSTSQLKLHDDRTVELKRHLDAYEARMKAQFTALETALARLSAQTPNFASLTNLNNY